MWQLQLMVSRHWTASDNTITAIAAREECRCMLESAIMAVAELTGTHDAVLSLLTERGSKYRMALCCLFKKPAAPCNYRLKPELLCNPCAWYPDNYLSHVCTTVGRWCSIFCCSNLDTQVKLACCLWPPSVASLASGDTRVAGGESSSSFVAA